MLATSVLFFVVSGIQFWGTDYMRLALHMPDEIVYPSFSLITLTAPTFGWIIGGSLTHLFGGYKHPNAIKLILYVGLTGTIVSLPIPFVNHIPTFLTLFWLSLFSGGFIMPGMTGIMINSVPRRQKALANSIAYVSYNLLGYLPGPLVYGFITQIWGQQSKIGIGVLIYSLILCVILLWFAYRNSSRTKVNLIELVKQVKEYKEIDSGPEEIENEKKARKKKQSLRYSMGIAEWNRYKRNKHFKESLFYEDLINKNPVLSPRANNFNPSFRDSIRELNKKNSIQDVKLRRKYTEFNRQSIGRSHRRGISLFDRELTSVGLPGQIASNIFQARQSSIISKEKLRSSVRHE